MISIPAKYFPKRYKRLGLVMKLKILKWRAVIGREEADGDKHWPVRNQMSFATFAGASRPISLLFYADSCSPTFALLLSFTFTHTNIVLLKVQSEGYIIPTSSTL